MDPPTYVVSGFLSHHIAAERRYNERNEGLGYAANGYVVGVYLNSNSIRSLYFGREWFWDPWQWGSIKVRGGAIVGAVTGYKYALMPLLLPMLNVEAGSRSLSFIYAPPTSGESKGVLAVQYRKRL